MPRELPGLYFDEEKNRYFPLSSKPKELPQPSQPGNDASRENSSDSTDGEDSRVDARRSRKRIQKRGPWAVTSELRSGPSYACRHRFVHEFMHGQIASTSRVHPVSLPGNISSFCVSDAGNRLRCAVGDNKGWLYQVFSIGSGRGEAWDELGYIPRTFDEIRSRVLTWSHDLNLGSEISSIHNDGSKFVATSLGPVCKVIVQDIATHPDRSFVLNFDTRKVADVWTSYLDGPSLVMGARKKAVFIRDLDNTMQSFISLDTDSDVFAVQKDKDLVYAGARNGSLKRFDTRIHKHQHGRDLLSGRYQEKRSSITHMGLVNEWHLVVNGINGDLDMFDLRFSKHGTPVMAFPGHVNSFTRELGFTIDAESDLLFAAGQDARLRAWSLRTGDPLCTPTQVDRVDITNPFGTVFERHVQTLRVTRAKDEVMLWANTGKDLLVYLLGRRSRGAPNFFRTV
ncbi:hypothetical protein OE88DRAFT_1678258 [Heliocybe sulcata]|uniref:WD40 repeat-like protein n=1 Tax=Heliocybe sulcata TaxID=5364 RepID=A0A5C3NFC1_9AGAM|nr:hypothetical protein OE88DRAFT_1678258 [Heliocybe sulcata]